MPTETRTPPPKISAEVLAQEYEFQTSLAKDATPEEIAAFLRATRTSGPIFLGRRHLATRKIIDGTPFIFLEPALRDRVALPWRFAQ